jgi:hypothetical protein
MVDASTLHDLQVSHTLKESHLLYLRPCFDPYTLQQLT